MTAGKSKKKIATVGRRKWKFSVCIFFFFFWLHDSEGRLSSPPLPSLPMPPAAASWIINNGNHDNCRIIDDFNQVFLCLFLLLSLSLSHFVLIIQIYGFCLHIFGPLEWRMHSVRQMVKVCLGVRTHKIMGPVDIMLYSSTMVVCIAYLQSLKKKTKKKEMRNGMGQKMDENSRVRVE